jgi:CheY-like chemotaxis protein
MVDRREAPTILVVDDSAIVLETTRIALESAGYNVITRSRGGGTVAAVLRDRPDLVLLDVRMPQYNGDTIASILTRSQGERRTIVLLYSSYSATILEEKVAQAGADGYIRKSGNPTDLVAQVNRWLKSRMSSAVRAIAPTTMTPPVSSARVSTLSGVAPSRDERGHRVPLVLFVDDDSRNLDTYRKGQSSGHLFGEVAKSTEQAFERIAASDPPDVVVCNLLLLGLDAVQLFERALTHERSWRHRFLFVSDAVTVQRMAPFLSTVGDRVLFRPLDGNLLVRAIRFAAIAARLADEEVVNASSGMQGRTLSVK